MAFKKFYKKTIESSAKMKIKKEIYDLLFIALFWSLIVTISLVTLIKEPQNISKNEGRELAKFPSLSADTLINGSFFEDLCDFYTDQLALKESFGEIYASSRLILGTQEVNGIVVCQNGALVARTDVPSNEILQKNLKAVQTLCDDTRSDILFVAPDSMQVFKKYLPTLLSKSLTQNTLTDSSFYEKICSQSEKYYYRTDHHWTTAGAYEAYRFICQKLGIEAFSEEYFTKQSVSQDFLGSSYRRSALPRSFSEPDEIVLYRHENDSNFTVTDLENNVELGGIYHLDELSGADPYRVFLGGNHARISVKAQSEQAREKMLIIKDSFANSLIPFLALHYDLEVIDPRYASYATAKELGSLDVFDSILVLCSDNTLATEAVYGDFINTVLEYDKAKRAENLSPF